MKLNLVLYCRFWLIVRTTQGWVSYMRIYIYGPTKWVKQVLWLGWISIFQPTDANILASCMRVWRFIESIYFLYLCGCHIWIDISILYSQPTTSRSHPLWAITLPSYIQLFLDFKSRHIALNEITHTWYICCLVIVRLCGTYTGAEWVDTFRALVITCMLTEIKVSFSI